MLSTNYDKTNIPKAIMAGACIALGGFGFMSLGGLQGAVIFALGLVVILSLGFHLFTGRVGAINFTEKYNDIRVLNLPPIFDLFYRNLFWNIVGVGIIALIAIFGGFEDISLKASDLIQKRLELGNLEVFLRAIGCGLIMDLIVNSYKKTESFVAVLLGVPLFIMCGFLHSIAEPFYIMAAIPCLESDIILPILLYYLFVVLGNFLGCRIRRIFIIDWNK
jgi:formate/nitrite transporter FocA (FNT family)